MEKYFKCPDCGGDGIETCHNPDHGFIGFGSLLGAVLSANESACPCCGHNEEHKMKGVCYTCKGIGKVSEKTFLKYIDEYVTNDEEYEYLMEYYNEKSDGKKL